MILLDCLTVVSVSAASAVWSVMHYRDRMHAREVELDRQEREAMDPKAARQAVEEKRRTLERCRHECMLGIDLATKRGTDFSVCLNAFPGGAGTNDMVHQALQADVEVRMLPETLR